MEKSVFLMKGLTCSNCAGKIESGVNKLNFVGEAEINLLKQEMTVSYTEGEKENVFQSIKKITAKYEPDVLVSDKGERAKAHTQEHSHEQGCSHEEGACCGGHDTHSHEQEHNEGEHGLGHGELNLKNKIIQFGLGIAFFLAAILVSEPSWLRILLFIVSYFILGTEVLIRALKNISRGQVFDENFLMAISTIGAIAIGEMPEAVFVMLFYQIGETFQDLAVDKSRKSIRSLMGIRPDYANLFIDGELMETAPEKVKIGDIIVIKPGERVPLDGVVIEGKSSVDTSALTGESVPVSVEKGTDILSGGINVTGMIKVQVTKAFGESTVVKILELTENAAAKKTKTEQFITKFARIYTPIVVIAAAALAFIPPLLIPGALFQTWIYRAIIFLVVSCPCALVLSVPLGFFSGIGEGSKNGVLFKGSNYLQALCEVNTAVLDKTGTITKGVFEVTEMKAVGIDEETLLKTAAYVEKLSNHPIAKSITQVYEKTEEIDLAQIRDYEEISGHGVSAVVDGNKIYAGNARLMEKVGVKWDTYNDIGSVVYIADDSKYLGRIVVSDKIKEDSKLAIERLKKAGIKEVVMLTGDNKQSAEAVGRAVGVDRVESQLLPGDKVARVEEIYARNKDAKILFVGDGINDAPVLSRAEVGIAMGGVGSDAAIEAADVVIMNDSLLKITDAITISKNTNRLVKQNIVFALVVKGIVLLLGAVGIANIWMAVFADVGVAFIAILNSTRKKI